MRRLCKAGLLLGAVLLAGAAPARAQPPVAEAGPVTVAPDTDDDVQDEAWVVVVNDLAQQGELGGKLFGSAGGDPAMNGLYTYLAFYLSPNDGWRVFRIGDFLSYRIVAEQRGRVVIEVSESIMNPRTSEIGSRTRRLAVSWTAGPEGAPPERVTVRTVPTPRRRR